MDWFRSYHGAHCDSKLRAVAKRSETQAGVTAAIWWALLDYASQNSDRGSVAGFDCETLACAYDWPEDLIARVIEAMREKGMITDDRITNWAKRQPKREDLSTDRVRAHRERQREERNAPQRSETQGNARGEERREEQSTTPPSPPAGATNRQTFLDSLPPGQSRVRWEAQINGWLNGLGLQHAATEADIDAALGDYLTRDDRDYSPKHVRAFVRSAINARLHPEAATGPPGNGRSRSRALTIGERVFLKASGGHAP